MEAVKLANNCTSCASTVAGSGRAESFRAALQMGEGATLTGREG